MGDFHLSCAAAVVMGQSEDVGGISPMVAAALLNGSVATKTATIPTAEPVGFPTALAAGLGRVGASKPSGQSLPA
jgi:hypothetical protein